MIDVSPTTLDRMIADRRFPVGIKSSPGAQPVWTGLDLAAYWHQQGRLVPEIEKAAKEEKS